MTLKMTSSMQAHTTSITQLSTSLENVRRIGLGMLMYLKAAKPISDKDDECMYSVFFSLTPLLFFGASCRCNAKFCLCQSCGINREFSRVLNGIQRCTRNFNGIQRCTRNFNGIQRVPLVVYTALVLAVLFVIGQLMLLVLARLHDVVELI